MNPDLVTKLSKRAILGCCVAFFVIPVAWIVLLTYLGEPLAAILPRLGLAIVGFGTYLAFAIWMTGRPKKELFLRSVHDEEPGPAPAMQAKEESAPSEIVLRLPSKTPNQSPKPTR